MHTVANAAATERLVGARVTPSLFRVLRVAAAHGRLFDDADADEGGVKGRCPYACDVARPFRQWSGPRHTAHHRWRGSPNCRRRSLAATGLSGVLSYTVAQRRREIGLRAALGATRRDLMAMVLREGLGVTAVGVALGVAVAALATRATASVLFGVSPLDTVTFFTAPLLLVVVAFAACLFPAWRAATIDPAAALSAE